MTTADSRSPEHHLQAQRERLKAAGLRATRSRLLVLDALSSANQPLSAPQIADMVGSDTADRVTIYRTLSTLVEARLARQIDAGDRKHRYASDEHERHAHFVCDSCGTVRCLPGLNVDLNPDQSVLGQARVDRTEINLHGTCGECEDDQAAGGSSSSS